MTDTDRRALCTSIYYLKVEELGQICAALTVSPRGAKGTLAKRILNAVGVADEDGRAISTGRETRFSRYTGELDPETHILPGHYTNGPKMRAKLRTMIGDHFSFTNYGMEWIRERWLEESYPSFTEFASFWQGEYNRRRAGGEFESLVTNARVRFFRAMEGQGLSRDDLERAWQNERRSHVETVSQILSVTIVE